MRPNGAKGADERTELILYDRAHPPISRWQGRKRYLMAVELRRLASVLSDVEKAREPSLFAAAAVHPLMFTGATLNEILRVRREEVDLLIERFRTWETYTDGRRCKGG